jgi:two-component system chemotaxis response regulator CheY
MAKISVVDDSGVIRKTIMMILNDAGYEFTEAADGVEGLAKFAGNPKFDLIITDINMPNMDGLTMAEKIRAEENGKNALIFVVSTEGNPDLKSRAKAAGILAWMTKPPQPDKLREAVRIVLSKKGNGAA